MLCQGELVLWLQEWCTRRSFTSCFRFAHTCSGEQPATKSLCLHLPSYLLARQLGRYVTRRPEVPIRPISLRCALPCSRLHIFFSSSGPATFLSPPALNGFICHRVFPIYPSNVTKVTPNNVRNLIKPLYYSVQKKLRYLLWARVII